MTEREKGRWTRRAALGLGIGALSALGAYGGLRRWRTIGGLRHVEAGPGTVTLDARAAETLAGFLGAAFGVALSDAEREDLRGRLDYAVAHDNAWRQEYSFLADYLDDECRTAGAASFGEASVEQQDAAMRSAVATDTDWRAQRVRAFLRADGRQLLRMRRTTIPHLLRLYRLSSVPWRHRGYTSWPGVADNRLAYTRKLESARC